MEQRAFTMNLNMRQTIARCEKLHSTALLDPPIDQPDAVLKPQLCPGLRGGGQWEDSPLDRLLSLRSSLAPPPSQCLLLPKLSCRADEGSSIFCTTPPHTHQHPLGSGGPSLVDRCGIQLPSLAGRLPLLPGEGSFRHPHR